MPPPEHAHQAKDRERVFDRLTAVKKLRFLGLDLQDWIKVFFRGNAVVAIVILVLIMVFLFREGAGFFPQHLESLNRYRRDGLEFVDHIKAQVDGHMALGRSLAKARLIQFEHTAGEASRRYDEAETRVDQFIELTRENGKSHDAALRSLPPPPSLTPEETARLDAQLKALPEDEDWPAFMDELDDVLTAKSGQASAGLTQFDAGLKRFRGAVKDLKSLQDELRDAASGLKTRDIVAGHARDERALLLERNQPDKAGAVEVEEIDFGKETEVFRQSIPRHRELSRALRAELEAALGEMPAELAVPEAQKKYQDTRRAFDEYVAAFPGIEESLAGWRYDKKVPAWQSVTAFLTGKHWVTNSYWQDFYGMLPLLTGSVIISLLASLIAIPFGIGAAIFVNQVAGERERNLIKPSIEFIQAIPSVVLGFFGIVVLGELLRTVSGWPLLSWLPFFPIQDRLNMFTAALLLALMAVPTIFTLAEDAINNVPTGFTHASLAVGANKLQTVFRIVIPASLSGIVAAILLGFGRVIGETMVVLLVAGNRIKIPDFTQGFGAVFQPAHTMTGIIAQEMGEVVPGSLHYRALFIVGVVLFFMSLAINAGAQKIVKKYRVSIG